MPRLIICIPEKLKLTKADIDKIFEEAGSQAEAVVNLYKLVLPDFDGRERVYHPTAGRKLNEYITKKFIKFDQEKHPTVLSGGAWLNYGFSTSEDLDDWEVVES